MKMIRGCSGKGVFLFSVTPNRGLGPALKRLSPVQALDHKGKCSKLFLSINYVRPSTFVINSSTR